MKKALIKKDILRLIRRARKMARENGKEIAGLLIYNGHYMEALETRNTYRKSGHFRFDERQIKEIEKAVGKLGHEIVGTFHSHPYYFAKPGDTDIRWAVDDELMLIIDCTESEAQLWRIKNGKARRVRMEIIEV